MDNLPIAFRRIRIQEAPFAADGRVAADHQVGLTLCFAHAAGEGLVGFFVDQFIGRSVRPQDVLVDAVRTQGGGVFLGVEYGFVVVCPGGASADVGDAIRQYLTGGQILELQGVLAAADGVHAEREQVVVRAHRTPAHSEVAKAFGHFVDVQHHLFFRIHAAFLAAVDGVFFALLIAGVVVVPVVQQWHALIVLLNAANDFFEEALLEGLGGLHDLGLVIVFGIQIVHHSGGLLVRSCGFFLLITQAHPEVIVFQLKAVDFRDVLFFLGVRCSGELGFIEFGLGRIVHCGIRS